MAPASGTLFNIRLSAPSRATLSTLREEAVSHPVFGDSIRRRLYNLRHVYDPAFPPYFNDGDDLIATADVGAVHHPIEWVLAEGPRPDPNLCLQRLRAIWLHTENRAGQLNNDPVLPFRHQAALVEFLTGGAGPARVLIADEVGLGKTVEAGLVLRHLLRRNPMLRVLYITLGGLLENVLNEFERLDLPRWYYFGNIPANAKVNAVPIQAMTAETRLVAASIHKLFMAGQLATQSTYLGDSRFDVIIVDECHTLRAYGSSADSPQVWFSGARQIVERHLTPDGRVFFMSATPHQGHREVFLNLVALCTGVPLNSSLTEKAAAARGRVVFRIKEHVRDWDGRRVFPFREVRPPTLATPPVNYSKVLLAIGEHFDWIAGSSSGSQARAVGFVKSQALQYAASSLGAGFAYLLRRLLRYYPSEATDSNVKAWAGRLVPYRGESLTGTALADRWAKEGLKRRRDEESDDELLSALTEGYGDVDVQPAEVPKLKSLLTDYDRLFDDPNAGTKFRALLDLLGATPEPVVVFSQAVDTVFELESRLKAAGCEVYRVSGDMDYESRSDQIRRFRVSSTAHRVLVSSSAGGVGINLQVARHVVHFDLPWNPMALEQRVGRVHRIGSDRTILVDTILLEGSREADVFERITTRLHSIVRDLSADPSEREALFRRILASLNPEQLRDIMAGDKDIDEVGAAIDAGRRAVEEVDRDMRQIATQADGERGRARTEHLLEFLSKADIGLRRTGERTYATLTEVSDGEFLRTECRSDEFEADDWDESLTFDRIAAAYLQLRRPQTGGLGHPFIEAVLRAAIDLSPELEKARVSTWVVVDEMPQGLGAGDILCVELVGMPVRNGLSGLELKCSVLDASSGDIRQVSPDVLDTLLWRTSVAPSRRAGELPQSEELIRRFMTVQDSSTDVVRWPLAAIGLRTRESSSTAP